MRTSLCAILLTSLPPAIFAQNFSIAKIIDANSPRPDGNGNFSNPHDASTDGNYVVWTEQTAAASIWSANLSTLKVTRLADTTTPAPSATGNFTEFSQIGGGPYAGFEIIVRNGTAVFAGSDSAGNGLYSVPAAGGAIQRIVNYNTVLPNGGRLGAPGHQVYAFGVNDTGTVAFDGQATGNAADGTALSTSIYTAAFDGSNMKLIADEDHLFLDPLRPPGATNPCVQNFSGVAIGGNSVVFFGAATGNFWGIYALPSAGPAQGVGPNACSTGPVGPLVVGSGTPLPGDPTPGTQIPDWDFLQTDGQSVFFHGCDWNSAACGSSVGGGWSGIFSVPLSGGAVTKIVAAGDTLPSIGKVTNVGVEFSVDSGGIVFIALNETAAPTQRGIFLYQNGQISKVFASGDSFNGSTLTQNGNLEIWPQSYKNGKIAFVWIGGVFIATASSTNTAPPTITPGGVVPLFSTSSSIQPGSWVSIYGNNLIAGATPVQWQGDYPTMLGGTTVTINNKAAYLSYASPTVINVEAPDDSARGTVNVTVSDANGSGTATVTLADASPSFSLLGDAKHAAAIILRSDGSGAFGNGTYDVVGPPGTSLGYKTVPAKAGDSVVLFGVGFGPTTPAIPSGKPFVGAAAAQNPVTITIAGKALPPCGSGACSFAGLSGPGLFQINLTIPSGLGTGDQALLATVNGVSTQSNVLLTLQ